MMADWLTSQSIAAPDYVLLVRLAFQIVLTISLGFVLVRVLRVALEKLAAILTGAGENTEESPGAAQQRARTIVEVLETMGVLVVWAGVVVTVLDQLGFDITPVLAGGGIVGLAVGLGAQSLIRDFVSGFFILLENQVSVGDNVRINDIGGQVEAMTLRMIVLRDQTAAVHYILNGSIRKLSNATSSWSAFLMDIRVGYSEDTDRIFDLIRAVDAEMRSEPQFMPWLLEPIEILGVDDFTVSGITIRARIKTQPKRQRVVGREFLRRLKQTFDRHGVEIPVPRRVLYSAQGSLRLSS